MGDILIRYKKWMLVAMRPGHYDIIHWHGKEKQVLIARENLEWYGNICWHVDCKEPIPKVILNYFNLGVMGFL